jgi:hypothetical protein
MALRIKLKPLNVNYDLLLSKMLSPQAQSKALAQFARKTIEDGKAHNAKVLGRVPPYTVSVDGRLGAPLESVKPNGVVFVEYELVFEAIEWIRDMLEQFSPVGSPPKDRHPGLYKRSHVLVADNVVVADDAIPPAASKLVFVNIQPYARRIERGWSPQKPDGVYAAVADLASKKFSNVAKIRFGYETPLFGAIDEWAASPAGAAWGRRKRKGAKGTSEWLRRQPAIIVTL